MPKVGNVHYSYTKAGKAAAKKAAAAKKKKKKPQGKIVPARPNPKKKEKPAKKRRGVSRGGVQQVTRDGATDLGTPAGTKSSGSGSGKMVQSKVKKQTLATEFDALKPNAKNAERLKGDESKYASVMKERLGTRSKKKGKPFKLAPVGTPPPGFAKGGVKKKKVPKKKLIPKLKEKLRRRQSEDDSIIKLMPSPSRPKRLTPKNPSSGRSPKKLLNKGGFPDLTGDGAVTKADVLKGRGVAMNKGGMKKQYGTKNFMYGGSVMGKKKK